MYTCEAGRVGGDDSVERTEARIQKSKATEVDHLDRRQANQLLAPGQHSSIVHVFENAKVLAALIFRSRRPGSFCQNRHAGNQKSIPTRSQAGQDA